MNAEELRRHVFITDDEFAALLGSQVVQATLFLDRYAEKICAACGGECCRRIACGFHSAGFASCPIHECRPAKCRLYYCERVVESELLSPEERRLLNEPARGLSEILQYSCGFELLFEPPIRIGEKDWLALLGIEAEVRGIVRAFEDSHMDAVSAERRLLDVVRRIRAGA